MHITPKKGAEYTQCAPGDLSATCAYWYDATGSNDHVANRRDDRPQGYVRLVDERNSGGVWDPPE